MGAWLVVVDSLGQLYDAREFAEQVGAVSGAHVDVDQR